MEARGVDALQVLLAMRGDERVVGVGRLPAVDHEVAAGDLDVAEELRADVARPGPEEPRPVAVGALGGLEGGVVAGVVAEDESDHGEAIPIKPSR